MSTPLAAATSRSVAAPSFPRLLSGLSKSGEAFDLSQHNAQWGALSLRRARTTLLDELDASGLRGHGGAWFPVGTKWRAVSGGRVRRPVVVANGPEGEPASRKDAFLLTKLPHLVLDGASLAAAALGANRIVVYVPQRQLAFVDAAIDERRRAGVDPVAIEAIAAPDAYLSGQESAVVRALNDGPALPTFVGLQSIRDRGVRGRPTLVQNVETLAHVAMISRFGGQWFRSLGTAESPGTMLVTVTGRWPEPLIVEAPLGTSLKDLLELTTQDAEGYWGALLGGYGGGFISMADLLDSRLTEEAARRLHSSLGAGVVALLPRMHCPLAETARVVRYMERQSAGQCGPCVHGLADLAASVEALAHHPAALRGHLPPINELCDLIDGRGACRHPDGVTRFVRSALVVFRDETDGHLRHGPCRAVNGPALLPCPSSGGRHQ
ncbi:MAG TPA: NADH-ubiquinone oxidoreductase-F iron-sulfur binding region domain-containing protein [Acidimicrobiales bacterium]|nr:NADH-ubiquinone oxidoreductase-F iron-sulfur binding region domain-containing protein [Acidimicrobiales bacterium]